MIYLVWLPWSWAYTTFKRSSSGYHSLIIKCGYYVYNNYVEQELLENEPINPIIDKIIRHICHDKPRVTKFNIQWNNAIEYRVPIMETNHTFMFQPLQDLSNTFQPVQQTNEKQQQFQQLEAPQIFQQQVQMPMFQQ